VCLVPYWSVSISLRADCDRDLSLRERMPQEDVTDLLIAWNQGDSSALNRLMPLVESELRRLARYQMRREGDAHTLQTTALVNELYLKFIDQKRANWQNRAHFFAIAATIMRRILVDHARRQRRRKRGGGEEKVALDGIAVLSPAKSEELLALDDALIRLAKLDPLKSRIVELRHFGGLSVQETAEVLNISVVTVSRHWALTKSWLRCEVRGR
jgi:RNA polymerase sigma factor (TIGR02999 family)